MILWPDRPFNCPASQGVRDRICFRSCATQEISRSRLHCRLGGEDHASTARFSGHLASGRHLTIFSQSTNTLDDAFGRIRLISCVRWRRHRGGLRSGQQMQGNIEIAGSMLGRCRGHDDVPIAHVMTHSRTPHAITGRGIGRACSGSQLRPHVCATQPRSFPVRL